MLSVTDIPLNNPNYDPHLDRVFDRDDDEDDDKEAKEEPDSESDEIDEGKHFLRLFFQDLENCDSDFNYIL